MSHVAPNIEDVERWRQRRSARDVVQTGVIATFGKRHRTALCGRTVRVKHNDPDQLELAFDADQPHSGQVSFYRANATGEVFTGNTYRCSNPHVCVECSAGVNAHLGQAVAIAVARW